MTTDLLEAVDALTKPSTEKHLQDVYETELEDGRPKLDESGNVVRRIVGTRKVTVVNDPPLVRLQQAITSSISRAGGGGTDKHARNLLDSDALFEFMKITSTITDWCAIVKIRATRNPAQDLRRWYAARLATNPTNDDFYIRKLDSWSALIRAKLSKPLWWEVKDPCPTCHYSTWIDIATTTDDQEIEVERNRPVVVEYWPDSVDVLATATATCRRCGKEWRGSRDLRALVYDIDQRADTPTESTTNR